MSETLGNLPRTASPSSPETPESETAAVELPDVHVAIVDDSTVRALFADVAAGCEIVEVRVKGHPSCHSSEAALSLDQARCQFLDSGLPGLQLRYTWQGDLWCDTLMRTPAGTRLVRMRQPRAPEQGA